MSDDATLREGDFRPPVDLLLTSNDTGGRLLLIRSLERRGFEPPRHRHRNEDEIVYVLDGELTHYLDEREHRARAGSCLALPRGGEHGFVVETQEARLLTLVLPAGLEGYYLELDEAGREDGVTVERLVTVAARYGVEITGPPFGSAQRTAAASKVDHASRPGRREDMSAHEFLVTGGTGSLGRRVVERLRDGGREVRVMSHSGRPGTVKGDLLTGEGLEQAVRGVDVIVHCATSPTRTRRTDVEGTERLLRVAERAGVSHLVFVSIVGVDLNPHLRYYRMKLEIERNLERSSVPHTVLRLTQFHEAVLRVTRILDRLPVMMMPKDFLFQPIDTGEAADRLVELALSEPAGRVPDAGGPEVWTTAQFARAYFEALGRRRRVVEVPVPGKMARAVRNGAQLCPENRYGKIGYEEFLSRTVHATTVDGTTRKELA